jgi:hypothetical protein
MDVLNRKPNAVPQQLEKYAIKQFKESTNTEKQAKKASKTPSVEKDQDIAKLRKELALLKVQKGETIVGTKETKQVGSGRAKVVRDSEKVEVIERRRSTDQQPRVKRAEREVAAVEGLDRRRSADQTDDDDDDDDSSTAVIIVDQGKRRRSTANTPTGRSSMDSVELRREPRYHSPRTSKDLGRRDLYVVQVTETLPRTRKGSTEVTTFKERTVYRKEVRYAAVH